MSNADYTQLFEKLTIPIGQNIKFPFDLLHPDLEKELQSKTWPNSSRAMIQVNSPKPQIEFLTCGDYATVSMWEIMAISRTQCGVKFQLQAKINEYCKEMIQCEQEYSFPSNRKNRIIFNTGIKIHTDPQAGGYYGWNSIGFIIIRVIK